MRKHGLTIDSLLAADIVTADGELVRVDAEHHPDLFWAIRGGGGNFGVATRFKYRLHPVASTVGGMLILPATAETVAGFIAAAEAAPDELSTIANVMPCPPMPFVPEDQHGKVVIFALMTYAGETEAGERAVAPFRALATPLADMLQTQPYAAMYPPEDDGYHPLAVVAHDVHRAGRPGHGRDDHGVPRRVRCSDARGAAPGAWRGDGPGPGGRHGLRPPDQPDHGQRRHLLRGP